jgi:hypothetical protein
MGTPSPDNTLVTHARTGTARFLGHEITVQHADDSGGAVWLVRETGKPIAEVARESTREPWASG